GFYNIYEMDKSWMNKTRTIIEYKKGFKEFSELPFRNTSYEIFCLCIRCGNSSLQTYKDVK
ncbi:unnamed protein product, partial [Dovyalis caffra]